MTSVYVLISLAEGSTHFFVMLQKSVFKCIGQAFQELISYLVIIKLSFESHARSNCRASWQEWLHPPRQGRVIRHENNYSSKDNSNCVFEYFSTLDPALIITFLYISFN